MAAKMEKTKAPGIFKRGGRYVFSYRVNGRQRWDSCRTLDEARRAKAARTTDIGRGEFDRRSRITLREYALDWIERYQGRGRRGFRDSTRDDYRRVLKQYVFKYFPERTRLTEITPSDVAGFIAWLCDPEKQGQALSDKSVRNYLGPLSACMASAVREGLIRHNPTRDADLPHRPSADDVENEDTRAMTSEQLAALLAVIPISTPRVLPPACGDRPADQRGHRAPVAPPGPGRPKPPCEGPPRRCARDFGTTEEPLQPPRGPAGRASS